MGVDDLIPDGKVSHSKNNAEKKEVQLERNKDRLEEQRRKEEERTESDWFVHLIDGGERREDTPEKRKLYKYSRQGGEGEMEVELDEVHLPALPPEEYSPVEMCAYFYRRLKAAGHPDRINKSELTRMFEVSRPTVIRHFDNYVWPYVRENLGDEHQSRSEMVYMKAVKELMEEGKWEKASRAMDRWNDWMSDRGIAEKEAEKLDIDHGVGEDEEELLDEMFQE